MLVLALAAALTGLGLVLRLPGRAILAMVAALWAGVMLAHLLLPAGAPLRMSLGGSAESWFVIGLAAALGAGYRQLLAFARRRAPEPAVTAPPAPRPAPAGGFAPEELQRYARHIVLRELGGPGQGRLKAARVLVVGAGGLGAPVLLYLAAAGVGTLGVIDDDEVSLSNLQRQILHAEARLGMPKVFSAVEALRAVNPHVAVRPHHRRLTAEAAPALLADYDLVLDGSDNFATRLLVNAACVAAGKPLISGAITQWEGQVALFDPARGGPCYACIFPEEPAAGLAPSCAEAGVVGALPGVVGSMMAVEAIKLIAGIAASGSGADLRGRMMFYDGLWGEHRTIGLKPRPECPVCGGLHPLPQA